MTDSIISQIVTKCFLPMDVFCRRYRRENMARISEKYHFPCRWSQYLDKHAVCWEKVLQIRIRSPDPFPDSNLELFLSGPDPGEMKV